MTFALGFILGFLLAYLPQWIHKAPKQTAEPTEEERRRAEKALREYRNFMTYDGFSSHDGE